MVAQFECNIRHFRILIFQNFSNHWTIWMLFQPFESTNISKFLQPWWTIWMLFQPFESIDISKKSKFWTHHPQLNSREGMNWRDVRCLSFDFNVWTQCPKLNSEPNTPIKCKHGSLWVSARRIPLKIENNENNGHDRWLKISKIALFFTIFHYF